MPPVFNCATGPTDIVINNFTLTPYPLCIGQSVCATGTGTLLTPVIAPAKLAITGKYLGRIVYSDNHDLCALMAAQGLPCPIPTTLTSITACIQVKPSAPANVRHIATGSAMLRSRFQPSFNEVDRQAV
ncbi:hypothetical protein BGZ75_005725 [Mortierella antarctica]|nr:hypothetical protein BGZ75_005725 [Mortierella antarctica]